MSCNTVGILQAQNIHLNTPLNDQQFFYCKYEGPSKQPTCYIFSESWSKLLKSMWECSKLKVSQWKILHPSNTEDDCAVGLSSEDEAEGLEATPGVSRCSFGGPPTPEVQPASHRFQCLSHFQAWQLSWSPLLSRFFSCLLTLPFPLGGGVVSELLE